MAYRFTPQSQPASVTGKVIYWIDSSDLCMRSIDEDDNVTIYSRTFSEASSPTTGDDNTLGYRIGDFWLKGTTNVYVCLDASTGAASWFDITASGGGEPSDGDKGDVTVSSSGTVWTIDAGVVTLAKLVNATAQYKLLGRVTAGAGSFEEITSSANVFSILGAANYAAMLTLLGLSTSDSPQFTGIELGHASDTTLARNAAGVLQVEGVVVPTISSTNTLTNKRVTPRTGSTTSSATPTINTDNVDFYHLTAQAVDITSFTTNLSGTPTAWQPLFISVTGTAARAITWGASFEAGAAALPTTTVTTQRLDVAFRWNSVTSKWRCMASGSA